MPKVRVPQVTGEISITADELTDGRMTWPVKTSLCDVAEGDVALFLRLVDGAELDAKPETPAAAKE